MHENEIDRKRFSFYREAVFAIKGSPIPLRTATRGRGSTWTSQDVINEVTRKPGACPHVSSIEVPQSIFGIAVEDIYAWHSKLIAQARSIRIPYVRHGKKHLRAQSITTPILFSAVATYPSPDTKPSPDRDRWQALLVSAACARFGENLRAIIGHTDEAFFHVHILCDCNGSSVRSLHAGHTAADLEPQKSLKGVAYRRGCQAVLDYFHQQVGVPLGWLRSKPAPRQRMTRSQALRLRQYEIEQSEIELRTRQRALIAREHVLEADLVERNRLLLLEQEALVSEQHSFQTQLNLFEQRKQQIEHEAQAQWDVMTQAAKKLVAWQREIKDQMALEARLAKLRQRCAPGKRAASYDDDDDFSDVPF